MFEDLKEIVLEQGDNVNKYEKNVDEAAKNTGKAVDELMKTDKNAKQSNSKLLVFALTLCLLLTFMWLIHNYTKP